MTDDVNPEECFFIAPIGDEGSDIRERSDGVMKYIVEKAAAELGLVTVRADQISDPGQINLQVIDRVWNAKAAVADLTGANPNVFYELALRHTAQKPLVMIAEKGTVLPFDIAQMRTIFFEHTSLQSADECRASIVEQLRQAIDNGVVESPISTALDVSSLSKGSAIERSVAELLTTVEELASQQRDLRHSVDRSVRAGGSNLSPRALRDLNRSFDALESHLLSEGGEGAMLLLEQVRGPLDYLSRQIRLDSGRPLPRETRRFRDPVTGRTIVEHVGKRPESEVVDDTD